MQAVLKSSKPIIAAFDFDGTMSSKDSLLPFILYSSGTWFTIKGLIYLTPTFIRFLTGFKSRQDTKEAILSHFLSGTPISMLNHLGELFAASGKLDHLVYPAANKRLEWHLKQGHRCILISASIGAHLVPWGKKAGFHEIITSELEVESGGTVTGRLKGVNCWGPEKVRRLEELLGPLKNYTLYAYGDSQGDKELLAAADFPYYRKMP